MRSAVVNGITAVGGGNGLLMVGKPVRLVGYKLVAIVFCEMVHGTFCPMMFEAEPISGKYAIPNPPRITVVPPPSASHAKPTRGPKFAHFVFRPAVREIPLTLAYTSVRFVRLKLVRRLSCSVAGVNTSQRRPRLRVRRG